MSVVLLADFRTFLREVADSSLDGVLQSALDAAEGEACSFIGYDIALEYDTDPVPAEIKTAITLIAQTIVDQLPAEEHKLRREAAERLLRPFRIETGIAA